MGIDILQKVQDPWVGSQEERHDSFKLEQRKH
jgi:hypothetical protein